MASYLPHASKKLIFPVIQGPNELSILDASAIPLVLGIQGKMDKGAQRLSGRRHCADSQPQVPGTRDRSQGKECLFMPFEVFMTMHSVARFVSVSLSVTLSLRLGSDPEGSRPLKLVLGSRIFWQSACGLFSIREPVWRGVD